MFKKIVLLLAAVILFTGITYSAPIFPDVPASQWAKDAVAQLAAKGILEGYPDGTFKGDRALTRYEIAMVVARLLAKSEQQWITFATKEEAEALKRLLLEYKDELEAYGVRTTALESGYLKLDNRVTDLEHIRFYGSINTLYVGQQMGGLLATAGQANAFTVNDWSNGRPLVNGRAVTAKGILGFNSSVPNYRLGGEFAGYYSSGEPAVDNYWGVTPPYLSNPYTAASGGAGVNSLNFPFTRFTFDNFWLLHEATNTKLIAGTYNPTLIDKFILIGQRNPNINSPAVLPFFGANVTGSFKLFLKDPISYEVMYARMPSASNAAAPTTNYYLVNLGAMALAYNFIWGTTDGKITFDVMKATDERLTNGTVQNVGLITIPNRADPAGAGRTQGWHGILNVGPQTEGIWGAGLIWNLFKNLVFDASYGSSTYIADLTNANFRTSIRGGTGRLALSYKPDKWDFTLDYVSVSPTYDPMLFQYPTAAAIPVFLPYSTYYSNYYQLHDNILWPNNREGYRFKGIYNFNRGYAYISYDNLNQKMVSTRTNISMVGFIEPYFPELIGGGTERGNLGSLGAGLNYKFPNNLTANANYFRYKITRSASINLNNNMDLVEHIGTLGLSYPFNSQFTVYGNMVYISYKGIFVDQNQQNFHQSIPSLSASYQLSPNALLMGSYKVYDLVNTATANSDWKGNQTSLELRMKF